MSQKYSCVLEQALFNYEIRVENALRHVAFVTGDMQETSLCLSERELIEAAREELAEIAGIDIKSLARVPDKGKEVIPDDVLEEIERIRNETRE